MRPEEFKIIIKDNMSHVARITAYMKEVYSVFSKLRLEEERIARETFELHIKGAKRQGVQYNNLANLELSSLFGGMGQLLHTYLSSEHCTASAVLGERGKAVLTTVSALANPTFKVGGEFLKTRKNGQIKTFEAVDLRKDELNNTEAKQRASSLKDLINHITGLFSNLIGRASPF